MNTLEHVSFELFDPAAEDKFLQASEEIADWVRKQPGFQHRSLVRTGVGWADFVFWASEDDAKAAADRVMAEKGSSPFMQMIDPTSVEMRHYPIRHSAMPAAMAA